MWSSGNNMKIEQQLNQTLTSDSASASASAMTTTPTSQWRCGAAADADARAAMIILKLRSSQQTQRHSSQQWTEVDSTTVSDRPADVGKIPLHEIGSTALSIVLRICTVYMNVSVALEFKAKGQKDYFIWMLICMVVPMCITAFIYANMCHQDGKFSQGRRRTLHTIGMVLLTSLFLRYWNLLVYSVRCKIAEWNEDQQAQKNYYKLNVDEESDVAFIRLFECFLETTPLKILTISIMLRMEADITSRQFILILLYFASTAWSLANYSRCIRAAQMDKNKLSYWGMVPQLCWYFCIAVSRTVCIACVASLFPLWTIVACLCHAIIYGSITFCTDRPLFTVISLYNYLLCLALGIVYLYVFIPVKDAPTRHKYILYYLICTIENFACIGLFVSFATADIKASALCFNALCTLGIVMYFMGIACMIIYYTCSHPNVTAKKANANNN